MNEKEALTHLENMPEQEFQTWFEKLPARVKLCCKGGLVNWREVLPYWYIRNKVMNHEKT